MRKRLLVLAAAAVAVALVVAVWALWSPLGNEPQSLAQAEPSPEPAPSWVVRAAKEQALSYGEAHPAAAWWGLLHDPELGDLTGSGPDDPSVSAYAIVVAGSFPGALAAMSFPYGATPPVPRYIVLTYDRTSHEEAGVIGFLTTFDATRFPSLKPLSLN